MAMNCVWVVTERPRSLIQSGKMSYLHMVAVFSLRDRWRSSDIRKRVRVEALLLSEEPAEVVWALGEEAPWTDPEQDVSLILHGHTMGFSQNSSWK